MDSVIQTYDIVMLVVLAGVTLLGAWKGMVWQLASLASLLLSAAVALHFSALLRRTSVQKNLGIAFWPCWFYIY